MKRRQAIQNIAIISSSLALMPACNFVDEPVFENVPLEPDESKLLKWLTEAILPKDGEPQITTPEPTYQFVLSMINDCFDPEDIQKYLTGLKLFYQYIKDEYQMFYSGLNPEQHILLFTEVSKSEMLPESLQYFLNTTKQLTVRHFTTSEYFLKNHLDFEFVPGRYNGCVPLAL